MTRFSDEIPINSKEKLRTICNWNFNFECCKVGKNVVGCKKNTLICVTCRIIRANFKQQFGNLSYRLGL